MSPWITPRITKGIQLLKVYILHTCLFLQFSLGSSFQRFVHIYEAARNGPHALVRPRTPLDQQNLQVSLPQAHHYYIHRHRWPVIFARIIMMRLGLSGLRAFVTTACYFVLRFCLFHAL